MADLVLLGHWVRAWHIPADYYVSLQVVCCCCCIGGCGAMVDCDVEVIHYLWSCCTGSRSLVVIGAQVELRLRLVPCLVLRRWQHRLHLGLEV